MDTPQHHHNHTSFKTGPLKSGVLDSNTLPKAAISPSSSIPYTEIMLCEYYYLVNSLTKLKSFQLQNIQPDVNKVLTNLTTWLDDINSINTVELFSDMRHLKQKAYSLNNQQTLTKSSMLNSNITKKSRNLSHKSFINNQTLKEQ